MCCTASQCVTCFGSVLGAPLAASPRTLLVPIMAMTGVVKSFNPHKGWGFIECNGQDVFLYKGDLKGICVEKGTNVQFTMKQTEKGKQAENIVVIINPDEACYFGEIKSFNPMSMASSPARRFLARTSSS
ncbi:unnamed protein product [Effrenium voratum]|nr:unnamed protein product [Effrenium voratum]